MMTDGLSAVVSKYDSSYGLAGLRGRIVKIEKDGHPHGDLTHVEWETGAVARYRGPIGGYIACVSDDEEHPA